MTNDPKYERLRELSWRRKLTEGEAADLRAWLAQHPESAADWEAEAGLNDALGRLADAPVPSNFTARVLQSIEREDEAVVRRQRRKWLVWRRWRWLPKAAFAAVVLGAGLISYQEMAKANRRAEYGRSVAEVAKVASLPSPEVLKDFDAILVSNPTSVPDEELLDALK
jgi:hypothetical protein